MKVQYETKVVIKNGRVSKSVLNGFTRPIADEEYGKAIVAKMKPVVHDYVRDRIVVVGGCMDATLRVWVTRRQKNANLSIDIKILEATYP